MIDPFEKELVYPVSQIHCEGFRQENIITCDKLVMAIVQSHATANIKGNSRHICELMTQDRDVGARLIHLPEAALSGYVKSQSPNRGSVDWDEVKDGRINIRETARQLRIWTVADCNHRMARPNRPRNSLFVISDKASL